MYDDELIRKAVTLEHESSDSCSSVDEDFIKNQNQSNYFIKKLNSNQYTKPANSHTNSLTSIMKPSMWFNTNSSSKDFSEKEPLQNKKSQRGICYKSSLHSF